MYHSEFANSLSNIRDVADPGGEKLEEDSNWLSHDQFRDLLNKREQNIRRSSSTIGLASLHHRPDSPRPSIIPRMSTSSMARLQTVMATKSSLDIGNREEMERLEVENMRLKRQLETMAHSEMADSKYASLASEVVRLQDSVTQMERTKEFYESSTRQLVNVLECLSSQLKTNNSCSSHHSHHCNSDNGDHLDSDSFDSLLSQPRPSLDSASSKAATVRSSAGESNNMAGADEENFPTYENVFYDSPGKPEKVTSPDSVIFKLPSSSRANAPVLPPSSRMNKRSDSSSLGSAPTQVIRPTPVQLRETGARNRILMGSSSVRRAMSNRSNPEHASFTALRTLEANTSLDNPEAYDSLHDLRGAGGESSSKSRKYSYARSKSVASGLPGMGDISQDSSHDGSYATKSLVRKKKGDSGGGRSISRFFRQMKSSMNLGKDKNKKNKPCDQGSKYSPLASHSSVSNLRQQSQSCLTPRKLKQVQHHSTPRLSKQE